MTDNNTINVNLLTHLKSGRIIKLVEQGETYHEANARAQKELLTLFGLQNLSDKDASQFSIVSGDDAAGALIAISSLVLYGRSVAETVEFIAQLTDEFSQEGTFLQETKETLRIIRNRMNNILPEIEWNIRNRYYDLGFEIEVKDLSYYFDWDDDGIAGNEIIDGEVNLVPESINTPIHGGTFQVTCNTDKPIYLKIPEAVIDPFEPNEPSMVIPDPGLYEYNNNIDKNIEYKATIDGSRLEITVSKAEFRETKEVSIPLYDARGRVVANLTIYQQGDSSIPVEIPNFGERGLGYVASIFSKLSMAYSLCHKINADYYLHRDYPLPISPDDNMIGLCYSYLYSSIRDICELKKTDAIYLSVYQNIFNAHLAMIYLTIVKHWGDAVFYSNIEEINRQQYLQKTPKDIILGRLISMLKDGYDDFKETYFNPEDINHSFMLSRDIINILLARCYLELSDYATAASYYEKVFYGSGISHWDNSVPGSATYSVNTECIYSFVPQSRSRISLTVGYETVPVIDFKDVCFELAECYQYMGNNASAADLMNELSKNKYLDMGEPFSWSYMSIAELRNLICSPFFASYARRTVEGKEFLGLSNNEAYQTLWPIPTNELMYNHAITQNPGY